MELTADLHTKTVLIALNVVMYGVLVTLWY